MRNLEDELERGGDQEHPAPWMADVGDWFVGVFVGYERGFTRHGARFIAVAEDEKTGELVSLWLNWKVLQERFKEHRPRPGERFGVKRLPDSEKGYRRFKLLVDRQDGDEPDFFSTDESRHIGPTPSTPSADDVPF